jgi:hypothetical protein
MEFIYDISPATLNSYILADAAEKKRMLLSRMVDSPFAAHLAKAGSSAMVDYLIPWLEKKLHKKAEEQGWQGALAR